jgi:multimeric flavodoxin WrbA
MKKEKMKILVNDTLCNERSRKARENIKEADVIETAGMKISPCMGCNYCWGKTPGICAIHDDYEKILMAMLAHERIVYICGTALGFIDYKTKNLFDRLMPLLNCYIEIYDGEEHHEVRYDYHPQIALLYDGKADHEYMNYWLREMASNVQGEAIGAAPLEKGGELL